MKKLRKLYIGLILLFLYAPIALLILYSFNDSKSRAAWGGFTLRWYQELFAARTIMSALGTTLQWNRGDDIKSSKVFIQLNNVSIENETDWLQMANFHADWTKRFYDVIVPFIKG